MKAQELRIGNWVVNVDEYWEVRLVDFNSMYIEKSCPFKPIPITEDILLKCGFVEDGDYFKKGMLDMFYCFKYYEHLNGYYFYIQYSDSPFEWDDNTFYPVSCTYKHLHQLQNLYFTLTGQELTIKL